MKIFFELAIILVTICALTLGALLSHTVITIYEKYYILSTDRIEHLRVRETCFQINWTQNHMKKVNMEHCENGGE